MPKTPTRVQRIKLPPEVKAQLEDMLATTEGAHHDIEVMKKLGMQTSDLEEKLKWAETVRETLLKEFT